MVNIQVLEVLARLLAEFAQVAIPSRLNMGGMKMDRSCTEDALRKSTSYYNN